ncbi:type II toxin-antitoxin system HipA family toxin [Undibacterium baiyunense]|uniref:Type II toxin-antitoxin system HipA family toxin n=1 Tax=Undibacterium baiyunense TaxID=2828731 RepID=A0A941DFD3_9BURK|nr:type II toxin-antitoxin system HipA family toxin [Undibacterium baiyunense]MBR7747759.1 type II toxin-antitoxin system HipA family toxin [Undibacterium baiyunense]
MARRSKQNTLNVWFNGTPVGQWRNKANSSTFTYFNEWLEDEGGRPLSLSMPFTASNDAYSGQVVINYFDNLLPGSDIIRRRLAMRHNTGGTSPFQLLEAIGRDCVGAAQILPVDVQPEDLFSIRKRPLDEQAIAKLLRDTTNPNAFGHHDDNQDFRISIAGAQEKNALLYHQGGWYLPIGSTPTTHILKLPLGLVGSMRADMSTSIENEWLCSIILEGFNLPIAKTEILQFEEQKVLSVERFDRKYSDDRSWIVRLPQEDMCQALGCSPLNKYQRDGGPGIEAIMRLLLGSESAVKDRQNFFKTQVIFWLLAAIDGHAKKFSIFLQPNARYQATPIYDVLSAHPVIGTGPNMISPQDAKLAMAVRGSANYYHLQPIQRRHWSSVAKQVGLGAITAEEIIEEVLAQVPKVVESVYGRLPANFPLSLAESIIEGLQKQAAILINQC